MGSIPQGAFAVRKVRCNNEHTVSMSAMNKEKTEEKKENIFNPRPSPEGNISLLSLLPFLKIQSSYRKRLISFEFMFEFIFIILVKWILLNSLNMQVGNWRRLSTIASWWTASGVCTIVTQCTILRRTPMPRRGPAVGWPRRFGAPFWRTSPRPPTPPRKPPR